MLFAALVDNFNDDELGAYWGDSYGGVEEIGGRARVPLVAGSYAGYQSGHAWTLAGSSVYVKLATVPAASTATEAHVNFSVKSTVEGTNINCRLSMLDNSLRLENNVGYWDDGATTLTFDPTAHRWLRYREAAGSLYWETSPDGTTWTVRRTLATPDWITAAAAADLALDMYAYRDAGVSDFAEYDQLNTLSNGAVIEAAATLAAESALTAAATTTVVVSAALTADSSLTATPRLTVGASAAFVATATLTATSAGSIPEEVLGLAAGQYDLYIEQGATLTHTINCALDNPDFTWDGWQARAQIRTAASETAELLLDLTPYLTVDGPRILLQVPATVTGSLHRSGRWDLEVYQGPVVIRLLEGRATLSKEVTR